MVAEELRQRSGTLGGLSLHSSEDRGLVDGATNHVTNQNQDEGQQERHTPTPVHVGFLADDCHNNQHGASSQGQTQRNTGLRECAVDTALFLRCVLHGHQGRTAPFATRGKALEDTEQNQQDRCSDAD